MHLYCLCGEYFINCRKFVIVYIKKASETLLIGIWCSRVFSSTRKQNLFSWNSSANLTNNLNERLNEWTIIQGSQLTSLWLTIYYCFWWVFNLCKTWQGSHFMESQEFWNYTGKSGNFSLAVLFSMFLSTLADWHKINNRNVLTSCRLLMINLTFSRFCVA